MSAEQPNRRRPHGKGKGRQEEDNSAEEAEAQQQAIAHRESESGPSSRPDADTPSKLIFKPWKRKRRTSLTSFEREFLEKPYGFGSRAYWKGSRINKETFVGPFPRKKHPKEKWLTIIPILGIIGGLGVFAILVWDGWRSIPQHTYCDVLFENFTEGWNDKVWTKEVEVGGFGNGQFEMTTDTDENVFIKDDILTFRPTLQDASLVDNNGTLDLRGHGCTGTEWFQCVATTNTTNGTIINPVKSGRIHTKRGASIRFGRVEVTAKLPIGDWLWPAIWMMPTNKTYGEWPRSGEIDIMESRGNNGSYVSGGNNVVSSTLHFGPNPANNGYWRTKGSRLASHTSYTDRWHIYGIEWSERYIFSYVDNRLLQVLYKTFDRPFFELGDFPLADTDGSRLMNPWRYTKGNAAPFDQDFYLVISLAIGGTNGWWKDTRDYKPWLNTSPYARREFWQAKDEWLPTWHKESVFKIKEVAMWQQVGHKGCTKKKAKDIHRDPGNILGSN